MKNLIMTAAVSALTASAMTFFSMNYDLTYDFTIVEKDHVNTEKYVSMESFNDMIELMDERNTFNVKQYNDALDSISSQVAALTSVIETQVALDSMQDVNKERNQIEESVAAVYEMSENIADNQTDAEITPEAPSTNKDGFFTKSKDWVVNIF